jgi:hypothetical protein
MNPRVRFRETLKPLLEALTISPVDTAFSATGAEMNCEFIHLDIAEDGSDLKNRLCENGWKKSGTESGATTYHLGEAAVQLILRTGVKKQSAENRNL